MLIRFSNTQVLLAAPAADPPGGRGEQASGDPGNGVRGQVCQGGYVCTSFCRALKPFQDHALQRIESGPLQEAEMFSVS